MSVRRTLRGPGRSTPSCIALLGNAADTALVRQGIADLRLTVQEVRDAAAAIDGADVAIVVGATEEGRGLARRVGALRAERAETVLLAVTIGGSSSDEDAAPLYRAGAAGVYAWPEETAALRDTLRELCDGPVPAGRASQADRTLEREIRERLRAAFEPKPVIRVKVRDGVAALTGRVDRLWKKQRIDALIAQIPGIRAVVLRDLEVTPSGLRDGEIARSLRALLRGASSIEDRTLAVSVHDGHAVVSGSVISDEEWEHVRDLIALARGVCSITDLTVSEPKRKASDRSVARRLQSALRALLPEAEAVRPAVLGQVAVLRGQAPRLVTRREAERIARRDPSVKRVVNKIEVAGAAG